MCLIAFAYKTHPEYPLVLAANRDEFYARPSRSAEFWPDHPHLLGGRDLKQGGSWFGVTRDGRLAAVTNYRDPQAPEGSLSRGALVTGYLQSTEPDTQGFLTHLETQSRLYSGFNLLFGQVEQLYYCSNRFEGQHFCKPLEPGLYGLSNNLLETPWPKLLRAKTALGKELTRTKPDPQALLAILQDSTPAADHELPDTGVGLELERLLSSVFIRSPHYGTRASTVLLVSRKGQVTFVEQNYGPNGVPEEQRSFHFQLENA